MRTEFLRITCPTPNPPNCPLTQTVFTPHLTCRKLSPEAVAPSKALNVILFLLLFFARQRQLIKTTHKARDTGGKLTSPQGEVNHADGPVHQPRSLDDDLVTSSVEL